MSLGGTEWTEKAHSKLQFAIRIPELGMFSTGLAQWFFRMGFIKVFTLEL